MKQSIYIVGPCSAESREQVLETAQAINTLRSTVSDTLFIFRAGVWKPRTSPSSFQGAGDEALAWLQAVKARYHMPVATEVATPEHVQAALAAGIDYLWIGARTSASPIAVQAIAESIDHCAVRPAAPVNVLIKNPVNTDAALWIGNIERLERTGVPVMAVHRGCNHQPCWQMAHIVRTARPDIPMLLDPSHMSGDAAKVAALMDKITELGLNGAMIEVHCHPEAALSDRKQQVRPETLSNLINLTNLNNQNIELNWLRAEIDELDATLWETIAARMDVSRRIGIWKKANDVQPLQPARYEAILRQRLKWAEEHDLPSTFVQQIFDLIHQESIRQQK